MSIITRPTQQTINYHGTIYTVDDHGITDGRPETVTERLAHTPREKTPMNIHLQAAIAIAEFPDLDINELPVEQQIAIGQLHATIALAQLDPGPATPPGNNGNPGNSNGRQITIDIPNGATPNRIRTLLTALPQTEGLAGLRPWLNAIANAYQDQP